MNAIHSFWFAALSAPVMIANSPLPPSSRAASSVSVLRDAFGGRLVDEEIARVGLGVGVPRQHLDAALARLAQHGRDARRGSRPRPRSTSTLRVIQLSTSSFCFAGVEAGRAVPDQLDAELARRFLRAGAAADEVRIALRLRHHRDHRAMRRAAGGARGRRTPAPARCSERTSQTFVPATISEPARIARAQDGDLSVLHVKLLRLVRGTARRAPRAHVSGRCAIVASSSAPVSTPVSSDGSAARCSPFCSTARAKQPEQRAPDRAASAEHRRAAEHDRGDRVELVAGARVRLAPARDARRR